MHQDNPNENGTPANQSVFDRDEDRQAYETHQAMLLSERLEVAQARSQTEQELARLKEVFAETISAQKRQTYYLFGMIFLFVVVLVAWVSTPKNRFIPTTDATAICQVEPKDNPNLNDQSASLFAQQAVIAINSFDFANHTAQIDTALSHYFALEGRKQAVQALTAQGTLQKVINEGLVLKATATAVPSLVEKNEKKMMWRVRVPFMLEVHNATKIMQTQQMLATVDLKASTGSKVNPSGLEVIKVEYTTLNNFGR